MTTPTYPKRGPATEQEQSPGSKRVKMQLLENGQAADIGKAPPFRRLYQQDYAKVADADDATNGDIVSPYLGNPLRR